MINELSHYFRTACKLFPLAVSSCHIKCLSEGAEAPDFHHHHKLTKLHFSDGTMSVDHHFSFEAQSSKDAMVVVSGEDASSVAAKNFDTPSRDDCLILRHDSAQRSFMEEHERELAVSQSPHPSRLAANRLPEYSVPGFVEEGLTSLQIPEPLPPVSDDVNRNLDIGTLSKAHFQAFQPPKIMTPSANFPQWTIETAIKEVKILRKAFPQATSRSALLSMTAWFHLFCFFDDQTEKMTPKEARHAMKHVINILQATCRMKATSQNTDSLANSVQRAKIRYHLRSSSRLPSGRMVAYVTYLFIQHAQKLLGTRRLQKVAAKIINVFNGYFHEISCRESIDQLSVEDYKQLRESTIGLSPFWAILRETFFTESEALQAETATAALESHVAIVVGLQNDLVGLAKDLADGDRMSSITLRAERESLSIGQSLQVAIQLHNCTVQDAMQERRRIEGTFHDSEKASARMRVYADCIVAFMTTHFMWASSGDRYKPG